MKHTTFYQAKLNRIDKHINAARLRMYKYIKPIVKQRAIAIGHDITNTQYSLSLDDGDYKKELSLSRFQKFQDFINELSDQHRIDFYFTIENGKFKWL